MVDRGSLRVLRVNPAVSAPDSDWASDHLLHEESLSGRGIRSFSPWALIGNSPDYYRFTNSLSLWQREVMVPAK